MPRRNLPAQFTNAGFEVISLANSTASGLNSTTSTGNWFHISVETNSVRYRCDSTAPTVNTGVLLATGDHWLSNVPGASLNFQRQTGTCVLSVQAFSYLDG